MKNILILTIGSRGDVQPYVALGKGLQACGHSVKLATLKNFAGMAEEAGLAFAPLQADFLQLIETPEGKASLAGGNPLGLMKKVMPMLRQVLEESWEAALGSDLIIFHPKPLAGYHIAEKLGIPGILALPLPLYSPTSAFPCPALPVPFNLGWLNRLSYGLLITAASTPYRGLINRWRREQLGLGPAGDERFLHGKPLLKLYAYSPCVLPVPPDWDASTQVTGYWFLDGGEWQPPDDLLHFLDGGPPPVYVGFGSMAATDADRVTHAVLEAGRIAGQRLVLATGWGGMSQADRRQDVYFLQAAPHEWLFPRMAAVVHHGGAGTTAAGLRAGKPTVICPFFGDQPFWGRRVAALGAGPTPIPQKRLTAERLAAAITQAVTRPAMRQRAEAIGACIRAEDGTARAIEVIEAIR